MGTPSPLCRCFYWIFRQFALQIHWRPNSYQGQQRKNLKLVDFGSRDKSWQFCSSKTWITKIIIVLGAATPSRAGRAQCRWRVNCELVTKRMTDSSRNHWTICHGANKKNASYQTAWIMCELATKGMTDSSQNHWTIVNVSYNVCTQE